ncbi:MAG: lipopolysaccharide biosynthesis protein [Thermoproteus sp.]
MAVYRAGMWLYASNLVAQLGGYLFWFVAAATVKAEALGEVAYLAAVASILAFVLQLGVPTALARLYPATRDSTYVSSALALTLIGAAAAALTALWRPSLALLTVVGVLSTYYGAYFQAMLDTFPIFIATLTGQAARVVLALLLARYGPEALAATYAIPGAILTALGAAASRASPSPTKIRELVKAGAAVWLPGVVSVLGTNLGVVAAYNLANPETAGYVYIAQVLANAAVGPATIITGVLLPYLSSTERKEAGAEKAARLSLAISLPLAAVLIFGGRNFLELLGAHYVQAYPALVIYTVANTLSLPASVLSSLTYAQGAYATFLAGGLASNTARVILYLLYGASAEGVAASFLAGTIVALAYYAAVQRRVAMSISRISPKIAVTAVPAAMAALGIAPAAAGAALGYAAALKLHIVTRAEVAEMARQVLPDPIYVKAAPLASKLLDILD